MGKDEELLLANLEKGSESDSDEVVEEFKLPPPRVRRKRKGLPDTRVHGGSTLFTWRCCFSFIVASFLISGGLVLAFFIYNLHSQIYDLKRHLELYKGNSNTIFSKHEQKINELEAKQSNVQSFMATQEALVKRVDKLQSNVENAKTGKAASGDATELQRQITNIKNDLDTLQSSNAKAEATLSSTQQVLLKTVNKLNKDVQSIKVDALNPTTTSDNQPNDTKEYMTKVQVNALLKKFSDQLFDGQDGTNKVITELRAEFKALNVSHNQDLLKLAKNVISLKESTGQFQESFNTVYKPIIIDLRNATRDVFKQLKLHNDSFLILKADIKALNESQRNVISVPMPLTDKKTTAASSTTAAPSTTAEVPLPTSINTTEEVQQPTATEGKQLVSTTVQPQPLPTNATDSTLETPSANMTVPVNLNTNGPSTVVPVTPLANNGTMEVSTTNTTMNDAANQQIGPSLPDETKAHVTEYPSESPPHVFSSIPTQVYEQSSKDESEKDFKNFQSRPSGNSNFETDRSGDSGDFSSLLPVRKAPVKSEFIQPGQDQEEGNQWDRTGGRSWDRNQGKDFDTGGDDRETVNDSRKSILSRVVNLLKSRNLSKRQRQRLVERLLERQGPNFDGDK